MTFRKFAKAQTVAFATYEGDSFHRIASAATDVSNHDVTATSPSAGRSYYVDGVRKIDVKAILNEVGDKFNISKDPSDYIFEAIRANTTNIPNENHDGFHKSELMRFDLTAGKPVYRTYEKKGHFVNHKAEVVKAARGVIVDAHYFDETPTLEKCPGCDSSTKTASSRDPSGIHCKKCGFAVKDEFVEILVAVDQKKDPAFADGVRTGQLNAGSMGCSCQSTTCNVCNHVAYSVNEFCDHIRRGNKGTYWAKDASSKGGWKRIELRAAANELKRRGRRFVASDFCSVSADDGFEIRKAFEYCNQVEFDEYSRVDQPADPKALQREILKAASLNDDGNADVSAEDLALETQALILKAQLNAIEAKLSRTAQMDGGSSQQQHPQMEVDADAMSNDMTVDADMEVESLAILGPNGEITELPDGTEIIDNHDPSRQQQPGQDPNQPNQSPSNIQDLTREVSPTPGQPNNDQQWGPEALGILPKATASARKEPTMNMFARDYGDFYADVTPEGNAIVISKAGAVMTVSAGRTLDEEAQRITFGREVLASIISNGIVDTVRKYDGAFPPRFAQILDAAVDDMQEYDGRPEDPTIKSMDDDMRGDARQQVSGLPQPIENESASDMKDGERQMSPSMIGDKVVDHESDGASSASSLSSVAEDDSDMRDTPRPTMNVSKNTTLDHGRTDMRGNAGGGGKQANVNSDATKTASPTNPAIPAATLNGIAEQWHSLDHSNKDVSKGPNLDVSNYPNPGGTAFQQGHQKVEASVTTKSADLLAAEARYKKVNASRIAAIQKEAEDRIAAAEATIATRFARALRIVAKREALNLEESPFKAALFEVLANEQVVGQDGSTGETLTVGPISADLAQHYTEKAFQLGAMEEIDRLVNRAAELMKADPGYIASAESDLQKQAAIIPTVTSRAQLGFDEDDYRANDMRREAAHGNLHLAPTPEVDVDAGAFGDKRAELSQAMRSRSSKTNQILDLIQVRPS